MRTEARVTKRESRTARARAPKPLTKRERDRARERERERERRRIAPATETAGPTEQLPLGLENAALWVASAASRVAPVPLGKIIADPRYQRKVDISRAQGYADDLRLDCIRDIKVNLRSDGTYAVMDGNHRLAALRIWGLGPEQLVEVTLYEGLSIAEEARIFTLTNRTKPPRVVDGWRSRVLGGEPLAVEIESILSSLGLRIAPGGTADGDLQAVRALERIYLSTKLSDPGVTQSGISGGRMQQLGSRRNPELLRSVLETLIAAWGRGRDSFHYDLLRGMALLLGKRAPNRERLATALAHRTGGPLEVVARSRAARAVDSRSIEFLVANVMIAAHNKGRRVDLIEQF